MALKNSGFVSTARQKQELNSTEEPMTWSSRSPSDPVVPSKPVQDEKLQVASPPIIQQNSPRKPGEPMPAGAGTTGAKLAGTQAFLGEGFILLEQTSRAQGR